ncbi:MAG: trans-sulfuration enzyme family protein [Nitrososphaerales archaeon]
MAGDKISTREQNNKSSKISPHSTPIFQTSVYDYPDLETFDDFYNGKILGGYIYSRNGLPNSTELGKQVAELERTDTGVVCSSGMGTLLVAFLSILGSGDEIVASGDLYGGTLVLLNDELSRLGIKTTFVDVSLAQKVQEAITRKTKLVLVESISNPTMKVSDIGRIAKIAHGMDSLVLVDNTFATPFVLRPSELGADLVMHSGTKFLGGHSDLTIGVLCGKPDLIRRASQFCTRAGVIAGPFDCWLATRSLSTWKVRMAKSCANALTLAKYLETRSDKVSKVYYPGLASHPQNRVAKKIFDKGMFGAMVSFDLKGGLASASAFAKSLSKITITPSLGGVRTTISHPGKTSHRHITPKERKESGITDAMIRVSVGIEDYDFIELEFKRALG